MYCLPVSVLELVDPLPAGRVPVPLPRQPVPVQVVQRAPSLSALNQTKSMAACSTHRRRIYTEKKVQHRSSLLLGGQNFFYSLPRRLFCTGAILRIC